MCWLSEDPVYPCEPLSLLSPQSLRLTSWSLWFKVTKSSHYLHQARSQFTAFLCWGPLGVSQLSCNGTGLLPQHLDLIFHLATSEVLSASSFSSLFVNSYLCSCWTRTHMLSCPITSPRNQCRHGTNYECELGPGSETGLAPRTRPQACVLCTCLLSSNA